MKFNFYILFLLLILFISCSKELKQPFVDDTNFIASLQKESIAKSLFVINSILAKNDIVATRKALLYFEKEKKESKLIFLKNA
jgi:hypothetical protein